MKKYKQALLIGIIMYSIILTNVSFLLAVINCIVMLFGADLGLELIKYIPETKYIEIVKKGVKGAKNGK